MQSLSIVIFAVVFVSFVESQRMFPGNMRRGGEWAPVEPASKCQPIVDALKLKIGEEMRWMYKELEVFGCKRLAVNGYKYKMGVSINELV